MSPTACTARPASRPSRSEAGTRDCRPSMRPSRRTRLAAAAPSCRATTVRYSNSSSRSHRCTSRTAKGEKRAARTSPPPTKATRNASEWSRLSPPTDAPPIDTTTHTRADTR
eukprot:scaffold13603_cov112-Isochrysis_galbana.AAC.1